MKFRFDDAEPARDPGDLRVAHHRIRRFLPQLYGPDSLGRILGWMSGDQGFWQRHLEKQIACGQRSAALVVSAVPLLVAAYSREIDWIALLEFPAVLREELELKEDDKLLTVNSHLTGKRLAPDLEYGPAASEKYANFSPLIADFFSDDTDIIEELKGDIPEGEWERTAVCAEAYLKKHGPVARNGLPTKVETPAAV